MVTLIAEVASNAGGSVPRAQQFIDAFAAAGANILKFQLTRVKHLHRGDPQYDWFRYAEWNPVAIKALTAHCVGAGVAVMFTVNHPDEVHEIAHLPLVKVGCGEAHQGNLATAILAQPFTRIYVSEGIRPVHASYRRDSRVQVLGVCPRYPAPQGVVGLRYPSGNYDGWSDHSVGLDESVLAVTLGATTIERHVQLRIQSRLPQSHELTVEEFTELRRRVDENPERFLGRWSAND